MSENGNNGDHENGHGPSLDEMLAQEVTGTVTFASRFSQALDHLHIPEIKDGEPDIGELIRHLMEEGKNVVGETLSPDPKDPQWVPTYAAIQNVFDTYQNVIVDGHLRKEVKDALVSLFEGKAQDYTTTRAQGRIQTTPLELSQAHAVNLAESVSNKYLVPLINASKKTEEIAARATEAIRSLYEKARQWYALRGTMEGFQPAYAGAHNGNGNGH